MKNILLTWFLLVTALATPAYAERVLFFGDSNMATGTPTTSIPALTMLQLPGDTHCISSVNGRNTVEGLAQISSAITACGGVTKVVLQLGIADLLELPRPTALASALNVLAIADIASSLGADVIIGTPPPAPVWGPFWFGWLDGNTYAKDIGNYLYMLNTDFILIDQRDVTYKLGWSACSTDLLHYTNQSCRQLVANLYATVL